MPTKKTKQPLRTHLMLFGVFAVFGLTIALVSFFLSSYLQTKTLRHQLSLEAHTELKQKRDHFLAYRSNAENTLTAVKECDLFAGYLSDRTNESARIRAQSCFLTAANSLLEIAQFRYIDEQGMERIRIDRSREHARALPRPKAELQNKSDRYYTLQLAQMPSGAYWYSALDLNIEHQQIVTPYEPTLRIAIPLYENGDYRGFMIINLLMQPLLSQLLESRLFDVMLVDGKGQLLMRRQGNNNEFEHLWAGMVGQKETLDQHWPEIASHVLNHHKLFEDNGRFSLALETHNQNQQALYLLHASKPGALDLLRQQERHYLLLVTLSIILCSLLLGLSFSKMLARLHQKLVATQEALEQQLELVDRYIPITHTDKTGQITAANRAFHRLTGFHADEIVGGNHNLIQHPDTTQAQHEALWKTISKGKRWHGEIKDKHKDGSTIWLDLRITPELDEQHNICGYTAISNDISSNKILEQQALHDPLTHLYNRRHFNDVCTRELRRCAREQTTLGLAMLDTDYFKQYNDTFGHEAGDQLLIQIAQCMTQGLQRATDFAFRIGGDEFAILFSGLNAEQGFQLLDRVRKVLVQLKIQHPENGDIKVASVSIGVALIQPSRDSAQVELFQAADEALYRAKDEGRNRVYLSDLTNPQPAQ